MSIRQFPYGRFEDTSLFFTTCFALSKNPAQHVLLEAAEKARRAGVQLSLDANYSEKIWPERREAQRIIAEYCRMGALLKISDADYLNLYGEERSAPEAVLDQFLKMGASEVCFTLGANGCWVANEHQQQFVPARSVDIKDAAGAGDAFWAGYLTAYLDQKNLTERAIAGRRMAEMKIGQYGPLPDSVDRNDLYAE